MEFDAEPPPIPRSFLGWYLWSLGFPTMFLIIGVTLVAMALVIVLFVRGRGPAVPAAMMFVLPLPLIVALVCFFAGSIHFLNNVAIDGPPAEGANWLSYAMTSMLHASSCFCPLLMLTLTMLMVLGFRTSNTKN